MSKENIAGVVLAGGKSSRMGENKALLDYNGVSLLDHMISILKESDLNNIYISGDFNGYKCIPDIDLYKGPAYAISNILSALKSYDGILFIPIDMPFLNDKILNCLLSQTNGAYFKDHPLPAFIKQTEHILNTTSSVRELLNNLGVPSVPLTAEFSEQMKNINTKKEWLEVVGS